MKTFDVFIKGILFESVKKAQKFADVVPPGWRLDKIIVNNHTASVCQASFGYTDHGITISGANVIAASATTPFSVSKVNGTSTPQSIYINTNGAADTLNGCTLDVTFIIESFTPKY